MTARRVFIFLLIAVPIAMGVGALWDLLFGVDYELMPDTRDAYTIAIEENPGDADAYQGRADLHRSYGEYEKAIQDYTVALTLAPERKEIYLNRAICYGELGQYEKAIEDCNRALDHRPKDVTALFYRGSAHGALGNFDQALSDLSEAIEKNPKFAPAYRRRAETNRVVGRREEAIEDLTTAINLAPQVAIAYRKRALARYKLGEVEGALRDLERAIQKDARDLDSRMLHALICRTLGRLDEAEEDYTAAIALGAPTIGPHMQRGTIRAFQGRLTEAIQDFDAVIERAPERIRPRVYRTAALWKLGRYGPAFEENARVLLLRDAGEQAQQQILEASAQDIQPQTAPESPLFAATPLLPPGKVLSAAPRLLVIDWSGDGREDLLIGRRAARAESDGSFTHDATMSEFLSSIGGAWTAFRRLDGPMVLAGPGGLLERTGQDWSEQPLPDRTDAIPTDLIAGDWNGDRVPDLLMGARHSDVSGGVPNQLFLGGPEAALEQKTTSVGLASRKANSSLGVAALLNDDRLPDFVIGAHFGPLGAWLNKKGTYFADRTKPLGLHLDRTTEGILATDFDGDGRTDLYCSQPVPLWARQQLNRLGPDDYPDRVFPLVRESLAGNTLLMQNEGGHFEDRTPDWGLERTGWVVGACTGDWDLDGKEDLATVVRYDFGSETSVLRLHLNRDDRFETRQIPSDGRLATIVSTDLTDDGRPDILGVGVKGGVTLFENKTGTPGVGVRLMNQFSTPLRLEATIGDRSIRRTRSVPAAFRGRTETILHLPSLRADTVDKLVIQPPHSPPRVLKAIPIEGPEIQIR